ncbi:MAG TPA: 6-carboxytetrahydropterin synthase [Candidatus Cloacimonetes bacterium]|nr:6-carboxytetrahydropterin synthase [Candidatus Cloacimonadota bacterium]
MFIINIKSNFSAAHNLVGYKGNCAKVHGHNWNVRLALRCNKIDEVGMTIDFKILKKDFNNLLSEFDHENLNTLECFKDNNPTSESIAQKIFEKAKLVFNNESSSVFEIEVSESEKYSVVYRPHESA